MCVLGTANLKAWSARRRKANGSYFRRETRRSVEVQKTAEFKWHVCLKKFETTRPASDESEWPENQDCRKELEDVRKRLISYTKAFGQLAGVANLAEFFDAQHMMTNK